jgi:hypothetical protein
MSARTHPLRRFSSKPMKPSDAVPASTRSCAGAVPLDGRRAIECISTQEIGHTSFRIDGGKFVARL